MNQPGDFFKPAKTPGQLIKAWRTGFGISQHEMARVCDITPANLSAIENDRREIGPKIALRLSAYMGLSPDVILYPAGYEAEKEYQEVRRVYQALHHP